MPFLQVAKTKYPSFLKAICSNPFIQQPLAPTVVPNNSPCRLSRPPSGPETFLKAEDQHYQYSVGIATAG